VVQRLFVPRSQIFNPIVMTSGVDPFDDNMGAARPLPPNFWMNGNFQEPTDFYDFYRFNLSVTTAVSILLNGIPGGSDYDLFLFNNNKLLWSSSINPGNMNEAIGAILVPGEYYVLVQRQYGASEGSNYWLAVLQ
jgi:hypothetical protein